MSSAFDRVLLLNVLLGLRIQPVLAADGGKHLCILPCTQSACETRIDAHRIGIAGNLSNRLIIILVID